MLIYHRIDILFCNDNDLNKSPIWLMSQVQLYSPLILDISFQAWKVQHMKAKESIEKVLALLKILRFTVLF